MSVVIFGEMTNANIANCVPAIRERFKRPNGPRREHFKQASYSC